jgi:hypothetical protein
VECLGLHNKPQAKVLPGHKLTGPKKKKKKKKEKKEKEEKNKKEEKKKKKEEKKKKEKKKKIRVNAGYVNIMKKLLTT